MTAAKLLIVLSAPSGAGKSTICDRLLRLDARLARSISATTRSPRGREREGRDYYFISETEFKRRAKNREFLEWACVHGHHYGTLRSEVAGKQKAGCDVIMVIDVQGGLAVKKRHPEAVLIFVNPPSFAALAQRLSGRGTEGPAVIRERLRRAREEMALAGRYDYNVVNADLKVAIRQVQAIITAERLKVRRKK